MASKGMLYLAGSTDCQPVSISIESDTLRIEPAGVAQGQAIVHEAAHQQLKISSKLGNLAREVALPSGDMLHCSPDPELDKWLYRNKGGKSAKLESNLPLVLASILLVPLSLFAIFKYVIPAMAVSFAAIVPDPVTDIASQHTLVALEKSILDESELSPETQQPYLVHWQDLIERLGESTDDYRVLFYSSEIMGPNAFALPDGTMVVTDQLVELLDGDLDMLTAIVLHEIGHVKQHHSMRLIAETLATSMAIYYFIGDLGGMMELLAGMSNTVMQNQFSQKLEWEADNYALSKLDQLGMSKQSFADAMQRFADAMPNEYAADQWFSTHPLMRERIENARSHETGVAN